MSWRVGSKVPLNVYEGDRPVCQCQTEEDAARIVAAFARIAELEAERDALQKDVMDLHRDTDEQFKEIEDHAFRVASLKKRITELETERDALMQEAAKVGKLMRLESAALRKALEDAEHGRGCASIFALRGGKQDPCNCWKSRIPEAR